MPRALLWLFCFLPVYTHRTGRPSDKHLALNKWRGPEGAFVGNFVKIFLQAVIILSLYLNGLVGFLYLPLLGRRCSTVKTISDFLGDILGK